MKCPKIQIVDGNKNLLSIKRIEFAFFHKDLSITSDKISATFRSTLEAILGAQKSFSLVISTHKFALK